MNRDPAVLFVVLTSGVWASAAVAEVTSFRATTDDRHNIDGHGYSTSGNTETFIIASADRQGRPLTPRVEREFDGKGLIRDGKGVYMFNATYNIESANDTTIFQLLNHNPRAKDVHKPMCFITVFPSKDGTKWQVHKGTSIEQPLLTAIPKTNAFNGKLQADGTRYIIWINDKYAASGGFRLRVKVPRCVTVPIITARGWPTSMSRTPSSSSIPMRNCQRRPRKGIAPTLTRTASNDSRSAPSKWLCPLLLRSSDPRRNNIFS